MYYTRRKTKHGYVLYTHFEPGDYGYRILNLKVYKHFYNNCGKLHRKRGPASIDYNGKCYYSNGIIKKQMLIDNYAQYHYAYLDGRMVYHNEKGPAIVYSNNEKFYELFGSDLIKEQFKLATSKNLSDKQISKIFTQNFPVGGKMLVAKRMDRKKLLFHLGEAKEPEVNKIFQNRINRMKSKN